MPAKLLIMLFADLGAFVALMGGFLGIGLWEYINPSKRFLTVFLYLSGVLGLIEGLLRMAHLHNNWCGSLWDLSIVGCLFPAIILSWRRGWSWQASVLVGILGVGWVAYYLVYRRFFEFETGFYLVLCFIALVLAGISICGERRETRWLGVSIILGFSFDFLPNSASPHWWTNVTMSLWAIRDIAWFFVYLIMVASLNHSWRKYESRTTSHHSA